MKKIKINYFAVIAVLLGTAFLGSCTKDMESEVNPESNSNGLIPINVVMLDYQDLEEDSPQTRSIENDDNSQNIQVFRQDMNIPGYEDAEIVTTIESTSAQEVQTRANMETNARFRMLVYNAVGTAVADCQYQVNGTTATLVSGTAPSLIEGTYKFVCYTKNTPTVTTGNTVNVSNGEDFATYCVTKAISQADNTVSIAFVRQIAQFQITAAATGFTNNTVSFNRADVGSLYTAGTWGVNYNSNDNIGLAVSGSATFSCTNNVTYRGFPTERALTITLRNLTIGGINKGDKAVNVTTRFEKGKRYIIRVNFTKKTGVSLLGLTWAPGNLVKQGNVYTFYDNQSDYSGVWNGGDYFCFNTLDPYNYNVSVTGSVWKPANDPCRQVAPAGTWRTPTQTEMQTLANTTNRWGQMNNRNGQYFGNESQLFLPAVGWRQKTTSITSAGTSALYWTNTPKGTGGSAVCFGFQSTTKPRIDERGHRAQGMAVRCVAVY